MNIFFFLFRIRSCGKDEASVICAILPQILNDFFPPSEILNKIILEFLSPQQAYPELMAEVVFNVIDPMFIRLNVMPTIFRFNILLVWLQVFQNALRRSQSALIQDWVLSLLPNFYNFPLPKAAFYSSCFFVSACTNPWLTAVYPLTQVYDFSCSFLVRLFLNACNSFPLIKLRHSELRLEDRGLLHVATVHFYEQVDYFDDRKRDLKYYRNVRPHHSPGF